ncbi:hypothetical protein CTAYLR_000755 [Chrysophaeum taylorii]|uniref:Sulfatase N-terminal domain-containing protein n=1 Tax=Chrysophaeum taylorii TaxID=2483200 RepID=A0AAD7UR11_9STRA|nr:hypothetical protein CTAYLR_000755 [Chrysophaeum taylorii]
MRRKREAICGRVVALGFFAVAACVAARLRWQLAGPFVVGVRRRREKPSARRHNPQSSVILFVVDDQGWNDFGHESTDLSWATPTLTRLADQGVRFSRYYALHLCTPSRAALLTGKHPITLGCQHSMITRNEPWGLEAAGVELLPETLARLGYATAIAGKWHLGHCRESLWPTRRGFDAFLGFFSGFHDQYTHIAESTICGELCFADLRDGDSPRVDDRYSLDLFADFAVDFVRDTKGPFFLYFSSPTVHEPLQTPSTVPDWAADLLARIPSSRRRVFAEMTLATDAAAAKIVAAADLDNVVFCYASDNGGAALLPNVGNNWPLRGAKGYYFEGGVRAHAFVRPPGGAAADAPRVYEGLFSVVDWVPTLLSALGRTEPRTRGGEVDGVDHWPSVFGDAPPARSELLINVDALDPAYDDLAHASAQIATLESDLRWIPTGALVLNSSLKLLRNCRPMPAWPVPETDDEDDALYFNWTILPHKDFVFNLTQDPTESRDLAPTRPDLHRALLRRFNHLALTYSREPTYCARSDDDAAAAAFAENSDFVGAWLPDDDDDAAAFPPSDDDDLFFFVS